MNENRTSGRFESALRSGKFVVTAEATPPDSADSNDVLKAAQVLGRYADALNVTDGSGANCHISSVAACTILSNAGYEVIFQMSCRDRNRIAMQAELLGASALGLHNVLCLTGDDVTAGDHPQAKRVFDMDSSHAFDLTHLLNDLDANLLPLQTFILGFAHPFHHRIRNVHTWHLRTQKLCGLLRTQRPHTDQDKALFMQAQVTNILHVIFQSFHIKTILGLKKFRPSLDLLCKPERMKIERLNKRVICSS